VRGGGEGGTGHFGGRGPSAWEEVRFSINEKKKEQPPFLRKTLKTENGKERLFPSFLRKKKGGGGVLATDEEKKKKGIITFWKRKERQLESRAKKREYAD